MGTHLTEKLREQIKRSKTPVVLAGSIDHKNEIVSVHVDYVKAVKEAVNNMLAHGDKRIAFVSGPLNYPINGEYRLKGYKEALAENGIEFDQDLVFETNDSYRAGETLWPALSAAHADAAFVADDELATGVLNGAVDAGAQIPAEFEVITGNDSKLTQIVRPKLSSITQPLYDIGAVAMRCLTKMMNKEDEDLDKTVELQYGFIKRGSTR